MLAMTMTATTLRCCRYGDAAADDDDQDGEQKMQK